MCSLPDDILKEIIGPLSFQDKRSLEVLCQGFRNILSSPVLLEGLWGKCDLMSDLGLHKDLDRKDDIVR